MLLRTSKRALICFVVVGLSAVWSLAPAQNAAPPQPETVKIDSDTFSGLEARSIGPAAMSGRIAALDVVSENGRLTVYVGAASGGVWKSVNGGTTFKPVFDKHAQSIGAVAIDPSNPKTVWVGTGEPWVRNSVSVGDGIYRTTDGGENWQRMGLADTERIARVIVDPKSSGTVYACGTGHLWNANAERGVFKTTDSGQTWQKILYINEDTGCAMLDMDPQQPQTLYAAMWQFRRTPHSFSSGGPGSGLFKSIDGGKTWSKLTKGLPAGDLGRIAVRVAPSKSNVVYAVVEAKKSALFRSEDAGETWAEMNAGANVVARPFYFANVYVDPKDANRIYKPSTSLSVSDDGGKPAAFRIGTGAASTAATASGCLKTRPTRITSMPSIKAATSRGSTAGRWRLKTSSRTPARASRNCVSIGTRPSTSARRRKAQSTSARSIFSARASAATRGSASLPI
ncbi:MAG: hypothetical protein LC742_08620 [Acidobacteria bacterium]|nr:hypothetical protein [Acidobacteriota bacterium]